MTSLNLPKLCQLARLDFSSAPEKLVHMEKELSAMIALAEKVQGAPTEGLAPLYHPKELSQTLREDVAINTPIDTYRELLLKIAPIHDEASYLVPKVID